MTSTYVRDQKRVQVLQDDFDESESDDDHDGDDDGAGGGDIGDDDVYNFEAMII